MTNIIYDEQEFLELLQLEDELRKQKKVLSVENREKYRKLIFYKALVTSQLHFDSRLEYYNLVNSFLTNEVNREKFFLDLAQIRGHIELNKESLFSNIKNKNKKDDLLTFDCQETSFNFADLVQELYTTCQDFDTYTSDLYEPSEYYTETFLHNYITECSTKIKSYLDQFILFYLYFKNNINKILKLRLLIIKTKVK